MSKDIKRILGIVSVFVLLFSLVSTGRVHAQTQGLINEEEYNLDNEYDQPVLYKESDPVLYDSQGEKSINTNRECQCRYNNLNRYGITVVFFLFYFVFAFVIASLVFNIVMIVDCINRDEKDFKDRTVWLVVLIVGALMGFGLIVSLVYFFAVKKKLEEKGNIVREKKKEEGK
jgi:triacylglycerol esterase/lipase EstA (alpha/beta hydrolase family)